MCSALLALAEQLTVSRELEGCALCCAHCRQGHPTIRRLTMTGCALGDRSATVLARALRDNSIQLEYLDLSNNNLHRPFALFDALKVRQAWIAR